MFHREIRREIWRVVLTRCFAYRTSGAQEAEYDTAVVELGVLTLAELERTLSNLPSDVIRAKGLVRCGDQTAPVEAHVVGTRRTVRHRPDLDPQRATNQLILIRQHRS